MRLQRERLIPNQEVGQLHVGVGQRLRWRQDVTPLHLPTQERSQVGACENAAVTLTPHAADADVQESVKCYDS